MLRHQRRTSTNRNWLLGRAAVLLGLTIGSGLLPGGALAAGRPTVEHARYEFAHQGTDTNICGDLGMFRFSGTDTFTFVGFSDGLFHFNLVERGTYTLTFLDEPHTTWSSGFTETISFNAAPGGTVVINSGYNSFEGPIRIHEKTTLVVGADGSIRVDNATFVVDECPPAI